MAPKPKPLTPAQVKQVREASNYTKAAKEQGIAEERAKAIKEADTLEEAEAIGSVSDSSPPPDGDGDGHKKPISTQTGWSFSMVLPAIDFSEFELLQGVYVTGDEDKGEGLTIVAKDTPDSRPLIAPGTVFEQWAHECIQKRIRLCYKFKLALIATGGDGNG
jgi:hypothetical protein